MRLPILTPDLGPETGRVILWCAAVGDDLRTGDRIAEVALPGLLVDAVAPTAGILSERCKNINDAVRTGDVLGFVVTTAEAGT
jgi:pyruvate/2-oxoglutarate dehydrogenase complex dihydrolipoamide acyltransferase (E2) component